MYIAAEFRGENGFPGSCIITSFFAWSAGTRLLFSLCLSYEDINKIYNFYCFSFSVTMLRFLDRRCTGGDH